VVFDCEELVGVTHRRWWDWYLEDKIIYSIPVTLNY